MLHFVCAAPAEAVGTQATRSQTRATPNGRPKPFPGRARGGCRNENITDLRSCEPREGGNTCLTAIVMPGGAPLDAAEGEGQPLEDARAHRLLHADLDGLAVLRQRRGHRPHLQHHASIRRWQLVNVRITVRLFFQWHGDKGKGKVACGVRADGDAVHDGSGVADVLTVIRLEHQG